MTQSITIIGAGIAGLAAGCYAQMNGYDSRIFEQHFLPGGLCTAWERDGYIFDGCIHYLFGSGPGQPFHAMWEELGAVQGRTMIDHDELMRVIDLNGNAAHDAGGDAFIVYCDPDRLAAHMKEISPADAAHIDALCDGVRRFMDFDMSLMQQKPKPLMGPQDWAELGLTMLPYAPSLARWGIVSAREFAARFRSPFLRRAVTAHVRLARHPHDGRHVAAGLHAVRQRRLSGRRVPGVRPRHRTALSGPGRADPVPGARGEDTCG